MAKNQAAKFMKRGRISKVESEGGGSFQDSKSRAASVERKRPSRTHKRQWQYNEDVYEQKIQA